MPAADHLRLLGDATRLRILHLLDAEPLTVAELTSILDLGQSSISGHLAKLKAAGLIHDHAEGSAHRYRLREDAPADLRAAWQAARALSTADPGTASDREALDRLRAERGGDWVERVAGQLHREYAPGRTWESLTHAFASLVHHGRVLDLGAGDGSLAGLIAAGCERLVCLDPSPAMVKAGAGRTRSELPQAAWVQATGERLPFPEASFDAVLATQCLQYAAEPATLLAEAARVLAPGGRLVVLTLAAHDHAEAERYGHRHRGFAEAELKRWTANLAQHRIYRLPPESRQPRFASVVLSAVRPAAGKTRKHQ
jgi:SAM-dependent methyltransferase